MEAAFDASLFAVISIQALGRFWGREKCEGRPSESRGMETD